MTATTAKHNNASLSFFSFIYKYNTEAQRYRVFFYISLYVAKIFPFFHITKMFMRLEQVFCRMVSGANTNNRNSVA